MEMMLPSKTRSRIEKSGAVSCMFRLASIRPRTQAGASDANQSSERMIFGCDEKPPYSRPISGHQPHCCPPRCEYSIMGIRDSANKLRGFRLIYCLVKRPDSWSCESCRPKKLKASVDMWLYESPLSWIIVERDHHDESEEFRSKLLTTWLREL